ncbi:hypothetical protein JOS77_04380 [Chromobacterium haemolyticum]|nr:hypothetical protein JOS77_04380 [Chromobacterium haemolyticum]
MVIMAAFEPIKNLIAWLWDGFTNLMKPIEDTGGAAQSMGQKIGAAVGQAIGGLLSLPVKAYQIGADMVTGLISGINKMLGSLKAAILGVGDMLPEWLRNKLDIHSPSRVFAGIGGYTMAGLEQGIVKNQDGPLAALRSATGRLTALGAGLMLGSGPALAGQLDTRPPLARPAMAAAAPIMINAPITIHAAPGMDERALARLVRQELEKAQRDAQARQRSKFGDID